MQEGRREGTNKTDRTIDLGGRRNPLSVGWTVEEVAIEAEPVTEAETEVGQDLKTSLGRSDVEEKGGSRKAR